MWTTLYTVLNENVAYANNIMGIFNSRLGCTTLCTVLIQDIRCEEKTLCTVLSPDMSGVNNIMYKFNQDMSGLNNIMYSFNSRGVICEQHCIQF
jgi:hypothetical protein